MWLYGFENNNPENARHRATNQSLIVSKCHLKADTDSERGFICHERM